ncbi:hypothetical protein [Mycolicibacterium fluoranthenivorans]|uniref:Uncharacterized protein n=1 Tax=Mycolicibacterium fluoranthenivorans TaxID=258505 RepID=A0A7X5U458_9MYCO|nr:hypothetical protein [Mycolicibacterium fluoranthenivorans]MCV7358511.1 hypothetical protein [Mycolicibacterium fluoranthenivorans]NIH98088.1 hypothetical protein [Mycolicibacterium fluoranthenivorans]
MLVTDKPEDIPTTNALDNVEDPDANLEIKPAYLALGTTPAAVVNPPAVGDIEYFMVRTRCTGEHGPLLRSDGEVRYRRDLQIQAIWKPGDPEPEIEKTQAQKDAESAAEAAANQPTLFDGQDPDADDEGVDGEGSDDESDAEVEEHEVDRPGFSDAE